MSIEVILPIYSTFGTPHLEYCVQLWGHQHQKDREQVQRTAIKTIRGLEHLCCEEPRGSGPASMSA